MPVGPRVLADLVGTGRAYARSANQRFHSRNRRYDYNPRGMDVFAADWDTLVILDGCRHDTFRDMHSLPGSLSSRRSRGSMTVEFLRGNLAGRVLHDTVYVTANGQFYNHSEDLDASFHHVENVWRRGDAWSDRHNTVPPEATTRYALRAAERFPDKRLVVHYVQPHYPFLDAPIDVDDAFDPDTPDFWRRVFDGDLDYDPAELRAAYERNLELALPHVEDLLANLAGKTVVTSDHGNMLGDRAAPVPIREWGHPGLLWVPELIEVPWLVDVEHPRPDIVSAPPPGDVDLAGNGTEADRTEASERREDDEVGPAVEEHLRHLGYRE